MIAYLEDWLQTVVGSECLSKFYALERVHRVSARPPRTGGPPRSVVAKLLHYCDRDYFLQQARDKCQYAVENSMVSIYPDLLYKHKEWHSYK